MIPLLILALATVAVMIIAMMRKIDQDERDDFFDIK